MTDDKRGNRDQQQGTDEQQDSRIRRERKPGASEQPGSGSARRDDQDRQPE